MPSINDEYEKLMLIGQGSFANIWKVRHKQLDYVRALKVSKEVVANERDKAYLQFLKECKVLLKIGNGGHPNIVRIYQPRLLDGCASVEMDYVKGVTLSKYLERERFMPMYEVYRFIAEIGGALAYCHHDIYEFLMNPDVDDLTPDPDDGQHYLIDPETERRLVAKYAVTHNDLHSNNVMRRDYDGHYVLLDFGLAILGGEAVKSSSRHGGALEYMAPEKFDDNSVITTQSDVYSFGVLMYEALAGRVPFVLDQRRFSSNPVQAQYDIMQQHKTALPPSIEALRGEAFQKAHPGQVYKKDYPDWLEAMIKKCLEKNPADRYADAKELMNEYKRRVASKPVAELAEATDEVPPATPANLIACPDCGKMISKKATVCPYCGRPLQQTPAPPQTPVPPKDGKSKSKSKKWIWWLIGGIVALAARIVGIVFSQPKTDEKQQNVPAGFVDLGLPSGTLWKNQNETNPNDSYDFYTYYEAVQQFGDQLPTKEQFEELTENCTYVWDESARGCWFYGPNGNSIFLPASGYRGRSGYVSRVGSGGYYWSSSPDGSEYAWYLNFFSGGVGIYGSSRCFGRSVRLVQD